MKSAKSVRKGKSKIVSASGKGSGKRGSSSAPETGTGRDRWPLARRVQGWRAKCDEIGRTFDEELIKEFLQRLDALRSRFQRREELAKVLAVTGSTIAHWRTGHSLPGRDHAIALAVVDDGLEGTLHERVMHWVKLCGLEGASGCDANTLRSAVELATSLPRQIKKALEALKLAAKLKGIPESDFGMALSCFLGHTRLEGDVVEWLTQSNGTGTTAIFWKYGEDLKARFEVEQTRRFFKRALEPDKSIRTGWTNPSSCGLKLWLFLDSAGQVDPDLKQLKAMLKDFREKLRNEEKLTSAAANRLTVYLAKQSFHQLADAFVFVSPKASFGALASGANTLMSIILAAQDGEISKEPWNWCSQIIQIEDRSVIEREWLNPRGVSLNRAHASLERSTESWDVVDAQ